MTEMTWFWEIVDRTGFASVPSDEREALSRIVSERDAALAAVARMGAEMEALRAALLALEDANEAYAGTITRACYNVMTDIGGDVMNEARRQLDDARRSARAALSAAPPPSPKVVIQRAKDGAFFMEEDGGAYCWSKRVVARRYENAAAAQRDLAILSGHFGPCHLVPEPPAAPSVEPGA